MEEVPVPIRTEDIALQAFLKWCGAVGQGGEAKSLIRDGQVQVNGEEETRRSRRLAPGDRVRVSGRTYRVVARDDP